MSRKDICNCSELLDLYRKLLLTILVSICVIVVFQLYPLDWEKRLLAKVDKALLSGIKLHE